MAAAPQNVPTAPGVGERCPKCSIGLMQRASVRSRRESVLFLLGASIVRCPCCEIRQAVWQRHRLQLNSDATDNTFVVVFASLFAGLLFCLAIALWALRRSHRWPF